MERKALGNEEIRRRLAALLGWEGDASELRKAFRFRDHIEAMGFVTRVALIAERLNHHPDLRVVYNRVELSLSTHDARQGDRA